MRKLLGTAQHVVDEGAVDVGAAHADYIEEQFVVGHKIPVIRQLIVDDLVVAAIAEHHESPRHRHGFSSCATSHIL